MKKPLKTITIFGLIFALIFATGCDIKLVKKGEKDFDSEYGESLKESNAKEKTDLDDSKADKSDEEDSKNDDNKETKSKDNTSSKDESKNDSENDSKTSNAPKSDSSVGSVEYETSKISFNTSWEFADFSQIHSGSAVLYKAKTNRKNIVVGVNAGHGTKGGGSVKTYCHPDKTAKITDGTTEKGAIKAIAVSSGMEFNDGTEEKTVVLKIAQELKLLLLAEGYDVLMIRDGEDVQLDNVARTVMCNNLASCHIALHFDGDGLKYDKGCFYMSVPNNKTYRNMYPVSNTWKKSHALGDALISGLRGQGQKIFDSGSIEQDLTQTSFSKVASIDIELGNQCSSHDSNKISKLAKGLRDGVKKYFG